MESFCTSSWFGTHYVAQAGPKLWQPSYLGLLNAEIIGMMPYAQKNVILNKQNPIFIIWLKKRKFRNTLQYG